MEIQGEHPASEALPQSNGKNFLHGLPLVGRLFSGEARRLKTHHFRTALGVVAVATVSAVGINEYRAGQAEMRDEISTLEDAIDAQQDTIDVQVGEIDSLQVELTEKDEALNDLEEVQSRTAGILGNLNGLDSETIAGTNLRDVSELPAFGEPLNPERQSAITASTVKIGARPKGSQGSWRELCTGVKVVTATGDEYVSSSAHCFDENITEADQRSSAIEILGTSDSEYAVLDPDLPSYERTQSILAEIDAVAIDASQQSDRALLHARSLEPNRLGRTFDAIPALSAQEFTSSSRRPAPGEAVAVSGISLNSGNQQVAEAGIYVGRVVNTQRDRVSFEMDVVAIPQTGGDFVVCDPGSSGGGATTEELILPSLQMFSAPDDFNDDGRSVQSYHLRLQEQLGVDLQNYGLCGYTVEPDLRTAQLENTLDTLPSAD